MRIVLGEKSSKKLECRTHNLYSKKSQAKESNLRQPEQQQKLETIPETTWNNLKQPKTTLKRVKQPAWHPQSNPRKQKQPHEHNTL